MTHLPAPATEGLSDLVLLQARARHTQARLLSMSHRLKVMSSTPTLAPPVGASIGVLTMLVIAAFLIALL